eukprot:4568998-Prymnesium_polylepis.1
MARCPRLAQQRWQRLERPLPRTRTPHKAFDFLFAFPSEVYLGWCKGRGPARTATSRRELDSTLSTATTRDE